MTKNQAHQKFLTFIESHPADDWRINGSYEPEQSAYVAVAVNRHNGEVVHFRCEYEVSDD